MPARHPVHCELRLPNPVPGPNPRPPERLPLTIHSPETFSVEIRHSQHGRIAYRLGGWSVASVELAYEALRQSIPGLALGPVVDYPSWMFDGRADARLYAVPLIRDRFTSALRLVSELDPASILLRRLASERLRGTFVEVQVLFRPTFHWEVGRFAGRWFGLLPDRPAPGVYRANRPDGFPYQVEVRVGGHGVGSERLARMIEPWLDAWCSTAGPNWWDLVPAKRGREVEFLKALDEHDIFRMASPRGRRDLSAAELAAFLPFPWKERHANVAYVGAPEGQPPVELTADPMKPRQIVVGRVAHGRVRLPDRWHHLAVVGRTGAGKSTLVRSIVLQVLAKEPQATVVVLEPTGSLIEGIVERLPRDVAADTIEIDPSRSRTDEHGTEAAAVPLNLLHLPGRASMAVGERERRVEKLVGDLIQAIRNAWGPESMGGRADHVLRGYLQALLPIEGTNLVDVLAALTEKPARERLARLGADLRALSQLREEITISSIDKVGKIAGSPVLRKAVCQRFDTVGLGDLLRRRLLLLNLREGLIGTEAANFLGALHLTQLWAALQERVAVGASEGAPRPVYLVVDEFQHYAIPVFGSMLSEGRRLGLRVIAATQTLAGIPQGIRGGVEGNVDAWVVFPVGAGDRRDAWRIVQGHGHGWEPDDLAEGPLGPYQAAYSAQGTLLKVTTGTAALDVDRRPRGLFDHISPDSPMGWLRSIEAAPPPPEPARDPRSPPDAVPPEIAAAARGAVDRSSLRYAHPEDSRVSPLDVPQVQRVGLLGALSPEEGTLPGELARLLGWKEPTVHAAVALSLAAGDVARDPDGRLRLLPRGRFYREAVLAARNEGEEHCGLLADVGAWLYGREIAMRVVRQEGGYQVPDGEFAHGGRVYAVEVECSSVDKLPSQVLANVRKALAAGRRCLLVTRDLTSAEKVTAVVRGSPGSTLMSREIGIVFRGGPGEMVPLAAECRPPWAWLGGHVDMVEAREDLGAPEIGPPPILTASTSPPPPAVEGDVEFARRLARRLAGQGLVDVTVQEFTSEAGKDGVHVVDPQRLGMALRTLGVRCYRARRNGRLVRTYDLRPLRDDSIAGAGPA